VWGNEGAQLFRELKTARRAFTRWVNAEMGDSPRLKQVLADLTAPDDADADFVHGEERSN
jgi:hypothetical protein